MSKRIVASTIGVLAIAIGAILFLTNQPIDLVNYPPKEGVVVAFGDSLVAGVGSSQTEGFIAPLEELLGREIINKGVPGNTTTDGLARLSDDVLALEPAVIFLLLGGNDFLRKMPREETFGNLESMIREIQDSGSLVVLLGVQSGLFFDSDENDFKRLAKKTGAVYVPNVLEGIYGKGELMHDAIHPNEAGYQMIAEKIYTVLVDWDIALHSL